VNFSGSEWLLEIFLRYVSLFWYINVKKQIGE